MKKSNIMVFEIDERMDEPVRRVDSDIRKNYFQWELNSRTNAYDIKYATMDISEEEFKMLNLDKTFIDRIKINGQVFIGEKNS